MRAFGLRPYERSGSNYNNQGVNAYPINLRWLKLLALQIKSWTGSPVNSTRIGFNRS